MNRYKDWLDQAKKDLEAANSSLKSGHFEWCCFQAQQSAEKALKALLLSLNMETWGHSLIQLLKKWKKVIEADHKDSSSLEHDEYEKLFNKCQELDRHYIQPRYPNGFASGHPAEYYNEQIALRCIKDARIIVRFVEREIEKVSSF